MKNDGGRVEMNVSAPVEETKEAKQAENAVQEEMPVADLDIPPEMDVPPDEAETGGNVYFDEEYIPKKKEEKPALPSTPSTPRVAKAAVSGDAKVTFGSFLRTLRKMGKSGVLFTICMDLDSAYEDGKFVLYTQSDTIYRSLTKPEHYAIIQEAFAAIGLEEGQFEICQKGKKTDEFDKGVQEIKTTFGGVKIDVK